MLPAGMGTSLVSAISSSSNGSCLLYVGGHILYSSWLYLNSPSKQTAQKCSKQSRLLLLSFLPHSISWAFASQMEKFKLIKLLYQNIDLRNIDFDFEQVKILDVESTRLKRNIPEMINIKLEEHTAMNDLIPNI
uniref:Uncharacterized protein n=1 Tax=Megaselia scalaris TaxID=36166 RepID=T1GFM9_MEGSC